MLNARILIVDDDEDLAESVAEALESREHIVTVAHTGEAAVELFKNQHFDIAFVDVRMPGINGVESFFQFRKIRPNCSVMMMTGYSVQELLDQAIDHGAAGVLEKPIDMNDMMAAVDNAKPDGIVLLVDDDPDFVASVAATLADAGYTVLVAHDGEQALAQSKSNHVDVLLLDLKLPVIDGLQVYMQLKEAQRLVPTLIVTGFADEKSTELAALQKMNCGYLVKPFDPKRLLDRVLELFHSSTSKMK